MKKYYSRNEVAKRWGCHPTTVDFRAKRGDLKFEIIKNRKRFHIDGLILLETVDPVRPQPKKARKAKTVVAEPKQTIFSIIKKYIYDRFIK